MAVNNYDHATIEPERNCPEPVISLNPYSINCAHIQVFLNCFRGKATVLARKAGNGLAQLCFHVHYATLSQNIVVIVETLAQEINNMLPKLFWPNEQFTRMLQQRGYRFKKAIAVPTYAFETQMHEVANCIPVLFELVLLELSQGFGKLLSGIAPER